MALFELLNGLRTPQKIQCYWFICFAHFIILETQSMLSSNQDQGFPSTVGSLKNTIATNMLTKASHCIFCSGTAIS